MTYYLETNSLRKLVPFLSSAVLREIAFSSIYSLMEIFSGITDEDSYKKRKSILDKILNSRITLILNLPETLLLNSFGFNLNDNEIVTGIGKVINLLTKSESLSSFKEEMEISPLKIYYDFLVNYDHYASNRFFSSFNKSIDIVRKNNGFSKLRKAYSRRWTSRNPLFANELYQFLVNKLGHSLWENKEDLKQGDTRTADEIIKSYNHSIDISIVMSAIYSDNHVTFGSMPGKNDFFDLSHLNYLDSIDKVIVTDDLLLHKLMTKSFSKLITTTEGFLKQNSI